MKMLLSLALASSLMTAGVSMASGSWTLDRWSTPYDFSSSTETVDYAALGTATKKWKLCVVFPHLKDPYWVATNYGVVEHARRIGVAVDIFESGGYSNLDKQKEQVKHCAAQGYDAILLGTVSYDQMTPTVVEVSQTLPVFATVNQIMPDGISGMAAVNWIDMGRAAGRYFAEQHPAGGDPVKVAWIPGPETAGWVQFTDQGFREEIEGAAIELVTTKYGDTGKDIQRQLILDAIEEFPDLDYIAGNAVAIEVAMSVLRQQGKTDQIKLVADYFTPAMYRGIRRGVIASAPTDSAALQGVLSVDQAVRYLEGNVVADHVGPVIFNVSKKNMKEFPVNESLAPSGFTPTFSVE